MKNLSLGLLLSLLLLLPLLLTRLVENRVLAPLDADALTYEFLAANIAEQGKLSAELTPAVLAPYRKLNDDGRYNALVNDDGSFRRELSLLGIDQVTTYRAPLFPLLVSASYYLFGRALDRGAAINAVLMGMAVLLLASQLTARRKAFWAILLLAYLLFSRVGYGAIYQGLTEPLAFFLVTLFFFLASRKEQLDARQTIVCGVILGALVLTRSVFGASLGILAVMVLFNRTIGSITRRVTTAGVMLAVACLLVMPWAVRNSRLAGSFLPLGSQGGIALGMVYSGEDVADWVNWTAKANQSFLEEYAEICPREGREFCLNRIGLTIVREWFSKRALYFPELMLRRLASLLWVDAMWEQRLLVILGLCGFFLRRKELFWVRAIFFSHVLAVMLTFNNVAVSGLAYGRYLFPVEACLLLSTGYLINYLMSRVRESWHRPSPLPHRY